MNDELKKHYEAVLKIRDEAAAKLIKMKAEYIEAGKMDEFMLKMYDEQITFIQDSIQDLNKHVTEKSNL